MDTSIDHSLPYLKSNHSCDVIVAPDNTSSKVQDILLNDIWSLYFHNPFNEDWTYQSYIKIQDISSVHEFWQIHMMIEGKIHNGIFFLFREYVFPCWDDENNVKGGCLSIKVLKQDMNKFWQDLCIKVLGETFLKEEYNNETNWNLINGISTSPKKYFCIIRIWVKSSDLGDPAMFNFPSEYQGDVIYRSNQQKIDENHTKLEKQR